MKQKLLNERYIRYRKFLLLTLYLSAFSLVAVWLFSIWLKIPSNIHIKSGTKQEVNFEIPATGEIKRNVSAMSTAVYDDTVKETVTTMNDSVSINMAETVTFYGTSVDQYTLNVKLFGIIPFKTAEVSVINDIKVIPVGKPIGIYVKTDGILVLETGEFKGNDGQTKAPAKDLLRPGDYILKYNGEEIELKATLMEEISLSNGDPIILTIQRAEEIFDLKLYPQKNEQGNYKLGIWIRDNAQGVGTMTFIDEANRFGALGHGINDVDTATLMKLKGGSLYRTEIIAVKKGVRGNPGEMTGLIAYSEKNKIGDILSNSKQGIFGIVTEQFQDEVEADYIDIALKQEVMLGPAKVMCCVDDETRYYDVEIKEIHLNHDNINRGIELEITDEDLLSKTGGIIQGMSGSPILQNGKIIGAVTHVLVNDSTKGYGIFIEEMME